MKSLKILFAALFLCAAFIAPAVHAQKEGGGKGPRGDQLKMLTENLQLTEEQVAKIKPIVEDEQKAMMALREDTATDKEGKMSKRREIMQSHRAQIRAVLTSEQQTKFDEMGAMGGKGKGKGKGKRQDKEN